MTTLHLRTSIGRPPLRLAFLLIAILFGCFALSQTARAVSPAPDGGYPLGNTAEGIGALQNLTTGVWNTANGYQTLFHDTTGGQNIATGVQALFTNASGSLNLATGIQALYSNTSGTNNTATGFQALYSNQIGNDNVANGYQALFKNTNGDNTATGFRALFSNTTGVWNEAYGYEALHDNVTGRENTAVGDSAGFAVTGSFNINIGSGVSGGAGENNTIRIGDNLPLGMLTSAACFIGGISGEDATGGDAVFILSNGKLGTVNTPSSARFKDEIKPMDKASEAILALKPVTFQYKKELDPEGIPQFGLVAEEVEKINPALVTRDAEGKVFTVRYDAVNAMLLNEFLKEHKAVQEQGATVAELKKQIATLIATVKEQASQIQKVSAQIEVTKPAPQTVLNNH